MKALVVCDDAEVIAQLDTALQQYGIDTILYRWLLKALDNIEEISPDFTIISASDYPRHWKTLSQFINSGIGRAANKIILYTPESLPPEERKKADALGILGCFSSLDKCEGGLETLHSFLGIKEREAKSGTTDKTLSASPSDPNNTEAADEKSALAAESENEETEIPDTQEISTEESPLEMEHGTENTVSNPDIANSYAFKKTALESTVGSDTDTSRTNIKEATDKSAAETVESATTEERTAETAASTEETLCDSAPLSENACTETADSEIPQEKTENAELDTETPETKTAAQTEETSSIAESTAETVKSATIEEKITETAASTEEILSASAPLPKNACTESADSEIPQDKTENAELDTANSEVETTAQTEETSFVTESAAETGESATIEEETTETATSTEETLCDSASLPENACVETADSEIPQEKTENTDLDTETPETKTAAQTEETGSVAESAAETVESATIEKETTETSASTEETLCDSVPLSENACVETADSEIPQEKTENEDLDTANSEAETVAQTAEPRFEPPLNAVAPESDTTVYDPPETETAFADETVIPSADEILSNVTQETKIHEAVLSSGEETIISTHDEDSAFPLNENEDAECKTVLNGAKEITADAFAAPPAGTSDLPSTKKPEKKRLVAKSDAKAAQGSLFPKANCTPAFIERFFQKLQSEALSTKAKNSSAHTASEYPEMTEKDASSLDCKLPSVNSIAKETDGDTRSCLKIPRVDTILTETASAYELCSEKNEKAPLPDYKIPAADSILKDESFLDDMRRDYRIPNVFSIFSDKNDLTAPSQTDIRIPSVASLLQTTETAGDSKNAEEKQGRKSLLHKIEKIYEK